MNQDCIDVKFVKESFDSARGFAEAIVYIAQSEAGKKACIESKAYLSLIALFNNKCGVKHCGGVSMEGYGALRGFDDGFVLKRR